MERYVKAAELGKPRNLEGGLVAHGAKGLPFMLEEGMKVAIVPPPLRNPRMLTVSHVSPLGENGHFVFFEEVTSSDQAQDYRGRFCLIPEDLATKVTETLPSERFIGYEVVTVEGVALGRISRFVEALQDLIHVEGIDESDLMIPFVEPIVVSVDPDSRIIEVDLPEGLLDLNESSK